MKYWARRNKPVLRLFGNFMLFFLAPLGGTNVATNLLEKNFLTVQEQVLISLISAAIATGIVFAREVMKFAES